MPLDGLHHYLRRRQTDNDNGSDNLVTKRQQLTKLLFQPSITHFTTFSKQTHMLFKLMFCYRYRFVRP